MADHGAHPIETLRARLADLQRYPPGVVPVPEFLRGTAFFSAAAGLVVGDPAGPLPPFPFGGVMFVAHNLDAEGPYRRRLASGHAHGGPEQVMLTWRNLYRLLDAAELDPGQCFFTNAYVGLKAGDDPTGPFPGAGDREFRGWCVAFLNEQIEVMRPKAVVTLGSDARRFMATMSPDLADLASGSNPPPAVIDATFGGDRTSVVPLLHPSGYHGSLGRRSYRGNLGLAAEAALVREAANLDAAQQR